MEFKTCTLRTQSIASTKSLISRKVQFESRMDGPDGGWAWCIALSACMINLIMAGLGRMSGILYVAFIELFHVDRKGAAYPFSIRSSAGNLLGPLVGILGQKYSVKSVTVVGGIVGALSSAACFFTHEITWITILWGGLNGFGTALTTTLPQVIIGQHFKKYKTTASGMAFSGGCIGAFIFPALIEFLLHEYGLPGTFLIMGGIILNVIPAAMVLNVPTWTSEEDEVMDHTMSTVLLSEVEDIDDVFVNEKCSMDKTVFSTERFSPKHSIKMSRRSIVQSLNSEYKNSTTDIDVQFLRSNMDLVWKVILGAVKNKEEEDGKSLLDSSISDEVNENNKDYKNGKCPFVKELEELYKEIVDPFRDVVFSERDERVSISSNCNDFDRRLSSLSFFPKSPNTDLDLAKFERNSVKSVTFQQSSGSVRMLFIRSLLAELCEKGLPQNETSEVEQKILSELRKVNMRANAQRLSSVCSVDSLLPKTLNDVEDGAESIVSSKEDNCDGVLDLLKIAVNLYRNPIFHLICVCRAVFFITFIPLVTVLVDFGMDKGLLEEDGKFMIAALSLGDLFGRLCLGWITDSGFITLPRYMLLSMIIQGASTATLPVMNSRATLLPAIALFGMIQGSVFVRHPVLVTKYMASHEQSIALGCINFLSGFIGFGIPIYIGYFRDTLGSYDYMFYITATIGTAIGLLWLLEPYFFTPPQDECNSTEKLPKSDDV